MDDEKNENPDGRFGQLNKHELSLLCLGITLVIGEHLHGIVTGQPSPPEVAARDFPVLASMMNEIGLGIGINTGEGLSPEMIAQATAKLDQMAAEQRSERNGWDSYDRDG